MSKTKHFYIIFVKLLFMSVEKKAKNKKVSVAERVINWLEERPYIKLCLYKDLINYSSLARFIQMTTDIKNFDAILISIRRHKEKLKNVVSLEDKQKEIIKRSTLEIRTGMNVYIMEKNLSLDIFEREVKGYFHLIEGYDFYVVITEAKVRSSKVLKKQEGLVEIRIKSPEEIETTPGIVFLIYQKLFERAVNIIETYSCWKDTLILVSKEDLIKTLNALEEIGIK